jgi:hypothetical protein
MHVRRGLVCLAVATFVGYAGLGRAEMTTEERLRALESALRKAQGEIERLRGEIHQQKAISQGAQTQIEEARKQTEDQGKKIEEAKKSTASDWTKKVSVFGDVRMRHEGFYHQPSDRGGSPVTARNRERIRARIGAKATLSDELSGTIRLASGNPDDPISTNETLTRTFTRKNINLDWAFITLTPGKTFNMRPGVLSLTGGKFPSPTFRPSEMVFDEDLSPEGFAETVQLLGEPMGALQQVKIHALQWTYNEDSNDEDGWMFGGQISPTLKLGDADVELGAAQYWYLNEDQIATAANDNGELEVGGATGNFVFEEDDEIAGFLSSFNITNLSAAVTFPNVIGAMPVRLWADYAHNWDAFEDDENDGAEGGVRLGQTKAQGDWAFSTYYRWIEQEAVVSAFSHSDFGVGGTNQSGPAVALEYQLLNPLTVSARNWFTNYIHSPEGRRNPTQFRLQLDAIVRF